MLRTSAKPSRGSSAAVRSCAMLPPVGAFDLHPRGPFDLAAAAAFAFGPTEGEQRPARPSMALAFCVDGFEELAAVALTQDADGVVHGQVEGADDLEAVRRQVARVLSLDHDGEAWLAVGARDPVIGRLQAPNPGKRPVLFHSPYEAAAWSVISARRPAAQGATVRDAIAERLGRVFEVDGERLGAFPTPSRLLEVEPMPGLPEVKVERLQAVARAALAGELDPARLVAMDVEAALEHVQRLPGIGPFYATLIVVRATGHADALATAEPRVREAAGHFYGLGGPATVEQLTALAAAWRPFRTWATVLLRSSPR